MSKTNALTPAEYVQEFISVLKLEVEEAKK